MLADGTHLAVLRLDGKPLGLLDEDARYAERRRRHAVLRALAETNVTLYEHLVCHDRVAPFPVGRFRSPYAAALARDYHAAIAPGLLARDWFLTIMVRPSRLNGLLGQMMGREPQPDASLLQQLEDRCATVLRALPDYGPRRLGLRRERGIAFSEIAEALRLMLYARWCPVPLPAGRLAGAIYTDRALCDRGGVEIQAPAGAAFARSFGFRDYPEKVPPQALDGLAAFGGRMVMTNSFRFLTRASVTDRFGLRETQMQNAGDRATSLIEGLGDVMDDVASGRAVMGDHHWCVTVHADSHAGLLATAGEMRSLLVNAGIAATPEGWGSEAAFWGQVPGAPAWLRCRHGAITGYNLVSLSPMAGFPRGGGRGHWGAPLLRLRTVGATAHDYHPHVGDVGHTLIFGPNGSGKTVFLALAAAHMDPALNPEGGVVVILDADGSNELTVRACGGRYTRILRGQPSGMAPFKALRDTPEARAWLLEFTLGLIMSDGGPPPSPPQVERLARGIAFLLRRRAAIRSFAALRQFADHAEGGCGDRLGRWCRDGALGWAFDGEEDRIQLDAGMVGIDNSDLLADDAATFRAPMAAYQLFRIGEKVGTGIPGAVLADEAQAYLPDARFAAGFERFVTRLRKGNGMLWLAMQQPQAILRHPIGQALVSNSLTKLLFPNSAAEADAYREGLHCTEGELEAVREGMVALGKGTFLVKRDEGSFIARARPLRPAGPRRHPLRQPAAPGAGAQDHGRAGQGSRRLGSRIPPPPQGGRQPMTRYHVAALAAALALSTAAPPAQAQGLPVYDNASNFTRIAEAGKALQQAIQQYRMLEFHLQHPGACTDVGGVANALGGATRTFMPEARELAGLLSGGGSLYGAASGLLATGRYADVGRIGVFAQEMQRRGHRQVVGPGLIGLAGRGRHGSGVQAAAAIPLMSAHALNARALAARYSLAVTWSRRRWKRLAIWSWAERKRCACRADLKRFICRSRRRVGWCEFSARLFRPLCWRCSTPGITSRFAAP